MPIHAHHPPRYVGSIGEYSGSAVLRYSPIGRRSAIAVSLFARLILAIRVAPRSRIRGTGMTKLRMGHTTELQTERHASDRANETRSTRTLPSRMQLQLIPPSHAHGTVDPSDSRKTDSYVRSEVPLR